MGRERGPDVCDPATGQWSTLPAMSVARYWATAVALNGRLYVVGGCDGNATVTTVEEYDPTLRRWRTLAGLPTARWQPGAGAIGGKLYAVGGGGDSTLAVTQAYTP